MELVVVKAFFIKYLLAPLMIALLAPVLGILKKKTPSVKGKVLIVYILITGLCLGILGVLGFTNNTFSPYWYLFAMVVYFFLGILNVNLLHQYFKHNNKSLAFAMLFEGLITLTGMLLGGYLFYNIFNWVSGFDEYALIASTCISIFIVPLAFYYTYLQFLDIPLAIYETWSAPDYPKDINIDTINFNRMQVLNIELYKDVNDKTRSRIKAKALDAGVSFGDWFHIAVNEYNNKNPNDIIHLKAKGGDSYSWIFYTKKSFFHPRKFIDFEKDITENGLLENSIIICKRVHSSERQNLKEKKEDN